MYIDIHVYTCVCVCIYIYIPSLLSLPIPLHLISLCHHRVPGWAPCVIQQLFITIYFPHDSVYICIYVKATFSMCPTLTFPCWVHESGLYQVHQYHFSIFHICVLIYNTCLSLRIQLFSDMQILKIFTLYVDKRFKTFKTIRTEDQHQSECKSIINYPCLSMWGIMWILPSFL